LMRMTRLPFSDDSPLPIDLNVSVLRDKGC
jgi:hypothetical protein